MTTPEPGAPALFQIPDQQPCTGRIFVISSEVEKVNQREKEESPDMRSVKLLSQ
jgi:hypothetical protein